jgi:hypothetical protein
MAVLRVTVLYPSAVLPESTLNKTKVFMFSASRPTSTTFGNIPQGKPPATGPYSMNLNNPFAKNAIAVSSYSPVYFDSADLFAQADLAGQLADFLEIGYIEVADNGTPLDRAELLAYVDDLTP